MNYCKAELIIRALQAAYLNNEIEHSPLREISNSASIDRACQ